MIVRRNGTSFICDKGHRCDQEWIDKGQCDCYNTKGYQPEPEPPRYKYRIVEFDGQFMIQAGREVTKGMLWWKRRETVWERTDINGVPLIYAPLIGIDTAMLIGIQPLLPSLEMARAKVKSWERGRIIHSI